MWDAPPSETDAALADLAENPGESVTPGAKNAQDVVLPDLRPSLRNSQRRPGQQAYILVFVQDAMPRRTSTGADLPM